MPFAFKNAQFHHVQVFVRRLSLHLDSGAECPGLVRAIHDAGLSCVRGCVCGDRDCEQRPPGSATEGKTCHPRTSHTFPFTSPPRVGYFPPWIIIAELSFKWEGSRSSLYIGACRPCCRLPSSRVSWHTTPAFSLIPEKHSSGTPVTLLRTDIAVIQTSIRAVLLYTRYRTPRKKFLKLRGPLSLLLGHLLYLL